MINIFVSLKMGSNLVNPKTAINVVKAINLSKTLRLPKVEQKETSKGQKPVFSVDEEDATASRKSSNGNSSPNTSPKEPEFVDIHPENVLVDWHRRRIEFCESYWPSLVF